MVEMGSTIDMLDFSRLISAGLAGHFPMIRQAGYSGDGMAYKLPHTSNKRCDLLCKTDESSNDKPQLDPMCLPSFRWVLVA